jgi:DNA polymerase-3 subunit gamma/tau
VCDSCVALAPNGPGNVDVVELDAASHGGVDDTRELRDRAFYAPAQSRYRIFIIDEAHMVTTAGFNALLKIVEEPPDHLIFVFATTEPEKVLPTIRSRTHHYPFRLLAPKTMRGLLERICTQENVAVDDAVYPLVIRAGGGSPRDTLSVLDQLLAGSDGTLVAYPRALALLGATDLALIDASVDALAAGDAAALFGAVESLIDAGHDPRRFATDLLERFRDLIVLQAVPDAASRGVVDAPDDVLERMRDQAARLGTATLTRYAEVVHAGLGEMRGATAPRLLLEVVCARLLLPSASDTEAALLQRIERIETRLNVSIPAGEASQIVAAVEAAPIKQFTRRSHTSEPPPPAAAAPEEQPAPTPAAPVPAPEPAPPPAAPAAPPPPAAPATPSAPAATGQPDAAVVRTMWSTIREKVRERRRPTDVMLDGAIVLAVEGDTLVLSHVSPPLASRLNEARNVEIIRDSLKDALGVNWNIRCEAGSPTAAAPAARPAQVAVAEPPPLGEDDEESMLAQAVHEEAGPRRDPEEVALELLQSELGARKIDGG